MTVYAVYYTVYAEGTEQEELQDLYTTREGAERHNTMNAEQRAWAGIIAVNIEELEVKP